MPRSRLALARARLRLLARGVDRFAATREWPKDCPKFVDLVKGAAATAMGA
jgi:hypothetical protein